MPKRSSPKPHRPATTSSRRVGRVVSGSGADHADLRRRLAQELSLVERRIREIDVAPAESERGASGESMFDETDHIHQSQAQEIRFATRERLAGRLARIRAALDRLAGGGYGLCVECGEPIGRARLQAMPEVERCVRCQERAERRGSAAGGRAA
jgi:DnaK suppressor protein